MFPNWASWQHALPIGVGAITGTLLGIKGGAGGRSAAGRWQSAVDEAQKLGRKAPGKAALQTEIAAQHARAMPPPTFGSQAGGYALPAALGAAEGAALPHMGAAYDAFLPALNPQRQTWERYRDSLPDDHPDLPRAQKIIESLPMRNPHQLAGQES